MLASRRPRHPVGWLLLAQVAANLATGAAAQYLAWGLLAGGPLPATRYVALSYPASAGGGLLLLGFVLLLTPTGKLPSPGWRWWARAMVAVPRLLLLVTLAPGSVDTSQQVLGSPFDFGRLAQAKVDPGCCQLPTNRSGQEVVVLGYRSEPYLRVGPTGVSENRRSPSAYANRFATAPSRIPADLDPAAPPDWRRIGNQPEAVWHDHRAHWSGPDPPAVTGDRGHRQVIVRNWQIPLRLGQRTALIEGDIVWVPGPSPWPWVLLALAAFAVVLVAGWRSWYGLLALLVVVAVAADLVHTAGAFAASTAPVVAKAYAALISVGGWVAAIVAVWQLRRGRLQAGGILLLLAGMFLAFAGALPDVAVLASSQVPSTLDPSLSRAAIALTLGLGLGLIGASVLSQRTARPATQPQETAG